MYVWCRHGIWLIWACFGISHALYGQVFPGQDPTFQGEGVTGVPSSIDGFATPGAGIPDSVAGDSSRLKLDIKPDTRYLDREQMFLHRDFRLRQQADFERLHYWDEVEALPGFLQHLGQVGKPYQILRYGLEERRLDLPLWRDPIMDRYDRYTLSPEHQVAYYDTRTPYVNVAYAQGPDQLQLTGVTLSQNITPWWNMTAYLKRRQAVGVYRNNTTDHYNLFLSGNYRSRNDRYYLFANVTWNQLSNELNGGSPRSSADQYPVVDGLIQEQFAPYTRSFFKGGSAPLLSGVLQRRNQRAAYADQYYHLIQGNDSAQAYSKLSLRQFTLVETGGLRYEDGGLSPTALAANLIPIYPTLDDSSTSIAEGYTYSRLRLGGEASYTLVAGRLFRLNVNGGLSYGRTGLTKDTLVVAQNTTSQYAQGELTLARLVVRARLRQQLADQLGAERGLRLEGELRPLPRRPQYRLAASDSLASTRDRDPLVLRAGYDLRDENPSLFQAFFPGDSGNVFQPNPDLENEQLNRLWAGVDLQGPVKIRRGDTLLPMYVRVEGFLTRVGRMIYYDEDLQPLQLDGAQQWVGATLSARLRVLRHFFLETETTWQTATGASVDAASAQYLRRIPTLSGRSMLYYDHRNVSFAEYFRLGIEAWYHTPYAGQTVDPLSGEFFPASYQVLAYARADAFAALRLRGVYLFFRMTHVNEGIPFAGYYTTPAYPMLERAFTLGVNWSFFQ